MLQYLSIPVLRGIEGLTDSLDRKPGGFRQAIGVAPFPAGSLTTGLRWRPALADGGDPISIADLKALVPQHKTSYHAYLWEAGDFRALLIGRLEPMHITGLVVLEGNLADLDTEDPPASTLTLVPNVGTLSDQPWFPSRVLDRIYIGNGVDPNLRYFNGEVGLLTATGPDNYSHKEVESFPPCRCFSIGRQRQIYAAGNNENPLRVWVGARITDQNGLCEGVESLETSYTDITPSWQGDYPITAISTFQHYTAVHSQAGVVVLFTPDGTVDGFKVQQGASPTNAGAANPLCAVDAGGYATYYLGADGNLYHDHSVRSGPYNKHYGMHVDVAPAKALGVSTLNSNERIGLDTGAIAYDRERGLVWVANQPTGYPDSGMGLWCYNEHSKEYTGPILSLPMARMSTVQNPVTRSQHGIFAMTLSGHFYCARFSSVEEGAETWMSEADLWTRQVNFQDAGYAPEDPDAIQDAIIPGLPIVNATPQAMDIRTSAPVFPMDIGLWQSLIAGKDGFPNQLYANAHPVLLETGWMDMGAPNRTKVFRELRLSLDWSQPIYGFLTAQSDRGTERTITNALIYNADSPVSQPVFRFSIAGKRLRVFLVLIAFVDQPLRIRGMELGFRLTPAASSR